MRIRIGVISLVAAIVSGCGSQSHTGPSSLASISIAGPSSVVPGASATFGAVGHFTDGTNKDYTTMVLWSARDSAVLQSKGNGNVTGGSPGETVLTATIGPVSGSTTVLVLPAGTFRLAGVVTGPAGPVSGAMVSITAGIGQGLSAVTDGGGNYRLYGVAGLVQLQVARQGYATSLQSVTVTNQTTENVTLTPAAPLIDLSVLPGTYAMDVTAAQPCTYSDGTLPDALKTRHYTATIAVNGTTVQVTLSGANFVLKGGHGASFTGQVQPEGLTFRLGDGYYYSAYPDLLEGLSPTTALFIEGQGALELSGTTLSGFIDGEYAIVSLPFGGSWLTSCYSPAHKIVLTRVSSSTTRVRR